MSEEKNFNTPENEDRNEKYSLNDDRRIKTLSPGQLVMKRFLRNKVAVAGIVILVFMFLFSFVGGWLSPYGQDQVFYRNDYMSKDYAAVTENSGYRYSASNPEVFTSVAQAQAMLAITRGESSITYNGVTYNLQQEGTDFYTVYVNGEEVGMCYIDIVNANDGSTVDYDFQFAALKAFTNGQTTFTVNGTEYTLDDIGNITSAAGDFGYVSRYVVRASATDVVITREWRDELLESIESNDDTFTFTGEDGEEYEYDLEYDPSKMIWSVIQEKETRVFDAYAAPSAEHLLGTDKNGMDMLTRLMYGGRVSLIIGFIVQGLSVVLGVIMGGISGYFGGWVDNLIMRIVDVFYCIPSMPLIIILGSAMDAMRVDPQVRMLYLMLILGFLGWPSMARLVRGQILSLREQEYMTAAEATGLSVSRRIFKHLVPNVIPQIIVSVTMGIGGTIITESTLSFLGLGVKFPFASWGNIINDVNNTFVLTNYWFIWIPAGTLLLLTVLAFNLAGDGLRDAFDPRMKR